MPSHRENKTRSKIDGTIDSSESFRDVKQPDLQDLTEDSRFDPPQEWPANISYSTLPVLSPYLNEKQRKWLYRKPAVLPLDKFLTLEDAQDLLPSIRLPLSRRDVDGRISVRRIDQVDHPACGQFGLFASRKLSPGDLVIPYIGYVHSSTASEQSQSDITSKAEDLDRAGLDKLDQLTTSQPTIGSWDTSDYDLSMIRDGNLELAVDAAQIGNEARFCNDYRGVPLAVSVSNQQTSTAFDRKSKRTAKSWNEQKLHQSESQGNYAQTTSIPNAEFRDVWFEWSTDMDSEDVSDLNQRLNSLQVRNNITDVHSVSSEDVQKTKLASARKRKAGMRGVAIFVLPAGKSGKRKHGIPEGHEILVSYGKGFWAHH